MDGDFDGKDSSGLKKIIFMHHPVINGKFLNRWNTEVISQNREQFMDICDTYGVDLVLTGHTHENKIYMRSDDGENYEGQIAPIKCEETLYVQTMDSKVNRAYRNITISGNDIWISKTEFAPR